jgi:hypothetical protein
VADDTPVPLGMRTVEEVYHLDNAARALEALAATEPGIAGRITIDQGIAEHLPDPDAGTDLIRCRDVLEHINDLIPGLQGRCTKLIHNDVAGAG